MALTDVLDNFDTDFSEIDLGKVVDDEDDRPEPTLAATPFFVEFDEPERLDPERAGLIWELQPAAPRNIWLRSPAASLLFHFLPVLAILIWPLMMVEPEPPIPVQLVFEQPPPPPPEPKPQPQPQPPPPKMEAGRLASVDMGAVKPDEQGLSTHAFPAFGDPQPELTENQQKPAAKPTPAPPLPSPKPAPPKEHQAAVHPPKPSGVSTAPRAETPHEAPRAAQYAGEASTRDEYLAYLVTLTRQHLDLLPMSVIAGRHGETMIAVIVYANGTIGPISVTRPSGNPDIDQRIAAMVAAVRKFPPLPQWYQGNAVQLELSLKYPEALEQK